jgi:hypothetical protein
VTYFADHHWWTWHRDKPAFREFRGQKCSIENTGGQVDDADVHMLRNAGMDGLSTKPGAVCTGQNGGYQAINIATLSGATRIVLLGYDMQYTGGKSHWHGDHPVKVPESWYKTYRKHFERLAKMPGLEILNASRETALTCFPRVTIEAALA